MELIKITHIGVVGAGLMGHGIAQVFASAGYDVNIYDKDPATLRAAKDRIAGNFKVFIELNLAKPEDVDRCLNRIILCPSIETLCHGPHFIIEAILEDLEIKRSLYAELERSTPPDTIFSSNTSAISITEISAALKIKGRFLGTHFWNPPHVLPAWKSSRVPAPTRGSSKPSMPSWIKWARYPYGFSRTFPGSWETAFSTPCGERPSRFAKRISPALKTSTRS